MTFHSSLKSLIRGKPTDSQEMPASIHERQDSVISSAFSRTSSSLSISSSASSKKLQWVLGEDIAPINLASWRQTPVPTKTSRHAAHARDVLIYNSFRLPIVSNDGHFSADCESDSETGYRSADDEPQVYIHALSMDDDTIGCAVSDYSESPDKDYLQEYLASSDMTAACENPLGHVADETSTSNSPDVGALEVSDFESPCNSRCSMYEIYTPLESERTEDSKSGQSSADLSFDALCGRLLDSQALVSASGVAVRPYSDKSAETLPISSSHSSTMTFPTSSASSISSCASSIESLGHDEQKYKSIGSLASEQAALEARLKLAAARDALKKVKSNVVPPNHRAHFTSHVLRQSFTEPISLASRPGLISRSASDNNITIKAQKQALYGTEPTHSSRSSRSSRRTRASLTPLKSDVRIGVSAPRNLNTIKKTDERSAALSAKSKPKVIAYIPQNHITSINEVCA